MPNTLSMATSRVWQNSNTPGVSETSAELNNFFYDTANGQLYLCTNPSSGIQTWSNLATTAVATLSSLTSIGTIGTGVWQGTVVGATYGGTGVNNGSNTLTLASSVSLSRVSSHTATGAFGNSLISGTAKQNTTGYDLLLNISVNVTSSTTATLILGVGSTSTPTTDTVVPSFTVAAATVISFCAIVPNNFYVLVNTTGTITVGSITVQACAE